VIKYVDKAGNEITKKRWEKLLRMPHYGVIKRNQLDKQLDVYTSWVGIVDHGRDSPGMVPLFLTWVKRCDKGRTDCLFEHWSASEKDAKESHQIALEWATAFLSKECTT